MENIVVKTITMPKRIIILETKYNTNIGIVVSKGAKIVQTTSAATETLASLYSVSPYSSSLMSFY